MSQYVGEENLNPQLIDKYRGLAGNVFSKKKVEWTVSTFQPYKSPDRDGFSGPASTVFTIFFPLYWPCLGLASH